jgi:hypothetical protein
VVPEVTFSACELKRSVTNAIDFPSADHAGCRSAKASSVSRRVRFDLRSWTNRSVRPPCSPENAIERPSGDHDGQ